MYVYIKNTNDTTKESYWFNSKRSPPHVKELNEFEDCMLDMIQWVEFKTNTYSNDLQKKKDVKEIQEENNIFVKADKTTNYYKTAPEDYVTHPNVPDIIMLEDRKIAEKVELDDWIEVSASRDSFITLKDHKPDFINNWTCRFINPSKSEVGIISKNILDCINKEVIHATKVNLWKSTSNTIEWFKVIPEKEKHAFITFNMWTSTHPYLKTCYWTL